MISNTLQQKREIQATAKALETLAINMCEAAGDPDFVAINAFRASLAVLSLRGQADRLAVATVEWARVRGIVERDSAGVHPMLIGAAPAALLQTFDLFFPARRLEDLGIERAMALDIFMNAISKRLRAQGAQQ